MPETEFRWVMLKAYDPRKGNVRERWRAPEKDWDGLLFEPEVVHKLNKDAAEWLYNNVRQLDGVGAEKSPRAFHIWNSYDDAKRGFHALRMEKLGRVRKPRGQTNAPPPLTEQTLTSIGDPEPVHELEVEPPALESQEEMPVNLGDLKVEPGYDDLDPGSPDNPEKPKKPRKKPGPKPGSRRKKK